MFSRKSKRTSSSMKMVLFQTDKNNNTLSITQLNPAANSLNNARDIMNVPGSTYRNKSVGMSWGSPTWIFLHTLVEKIKDEHFSKMRNEVLKNIYLICTNLPCPECSMHAKNYLNGQNFNTIVNKSQLKTMLYDFHNSVNLRKGYPMFNVVDLQSTYNEEILSITFYNFLIKFRDRGASNRYIHEDIYRTQLSKDLIKWFNASKEYFYE